MSETAKLILCAVSLFVLLPVGILLFRNWATRMTRCELDKAAKQFTERLLHPNLAVLEAHFKHPMPAGIRALYANRQELERGDFIVARGPDAPEDARWYVAYYQPADEQGLQDAWPEVKELFAFADDGCGNEYVIDPKLEDPPVQFYDHETGEFSPVCDTLSDFMRWPRFDAEAFDK
jgi:hypothetical protein